MLSKFITIPGQHLTDEALLILASDHSSPKTWRLASSHLEVCDSCRVRLRDTRRICAAWGRISREGLLDRPQRAAFSGPAVLDSGASFPWKPIGVLVGGCAVILAFLFNSQTVPVVNASSILTSAIQSERKDSNPTAFTMEVAGKMCTKGAETTEVSATKQSPTCAEGVGLLRKGAWPSRKPLSAEAFAAWRNSLPKKKDTVVKNPGSIKVDTQAPEGVLREASLTMRAQDYHALSLDLVFDNQETVTLTEDTAPPPAEVATALSRAASPASAAAPPPADPLDAPEVQAWALLDQLHADTGWEANVVRQGNELNVKARIVSPAREQQFRDLFLRDPEVKLDFELGASSTAAAFLPQRPMKGDSPALAQDWLEQQFPDLDARSKFSNEALELSQVILGKAFYLDQLKESRARIKPSDAAQQLADIVARQASELIASQKTLAARLRPLIGEPKHPAMKPLTYEQALKLDAALGDLLAASSADSPGFDQQIDAVRNLL